MKRVWHFLKASIHQRDWLGLVFLGLMIVVGAAAVSILFSRAMKEAALKRFHLASDSYPQWAAHQMVPAMYNFENRIKFSNKIDRDGRFDTSDASYIEHAINHFPARFITFGDRRHFLSKGREGMFEMESVFGDTALVSRWVLKRDTPGDITVHRVEQHFELRDRADNGGDADE